MLGFMVPFDTGGLSTTIKVVDKTEILANTVIANIIIYMVRETAGYRMKTENRISAGTALHIIFGGNTKITEVY